MPSGITSDTLKHLVLDEGVVYLNYQEVSGERVLGATRGGATFSIEREIKEVEVDGLPGRGKGFRRIVSENATLKVSLLDITAANLKAALAGTSQADYPTTTPTHDAITPSLEILDADYFKNVALVATLSGSDQPVVCLLYNALGDGNLEFKTSDKDEMVLEVTFTAHYDPADLTKPIWEVRYPKIVA